MKHYRHGLTLILAWISNRITSILCPVWDEIVYPFPNFNDYTVSNFYPTLFDGYNYLLKLWFTLNHISKTGPGRNRHYKINFYRKQYNKGQVAHPKNPGDLDNGWNSLKLMYSQILVKFMICTWCLFEIHYIWIVSHLNALKYYNTLFSFTLCSFLK